MSKTPTLASVSGTTLSGAQLKTFLTGIVSAFRTAGMQENDRATITSDTTLTVQNCGLVLVDCTGGNVALTLPTSGTTTDDAIYNIRRLDGTSNTLIVTRGGSDTIEGASAALSVAPRAIVGIQLPAGGSDWKVINRSSGTVGDGPGSNISSAATLNLTGRTGNIVRITGTNTTTAITMANGDYVVAIADGSWPISVSGVLNYTCTAGDILYLMQDGSGVQSAFVNGVRLISPIKQGESSDRTWGISTRSAVTSYPVPSIRPFSSNKTIALDVMPNGTPSESSGNGYAWIDVCSADVLDNSNAVYGARLAVTSTLARVASFNFNGATAKPLSFAIGSSDRVYIDGGGNIFAPAVDNTIQFGTASLRWSTIYAATGSINTSDEREKQDVSPIDELALDAWADVNFVQFRWRESVANKGDEARFHVGLIAQQVDRAFRARGLDAFKYGLLCYDEWEPSEMVKERGDRWGIRADQCLFMEAALMRRELSRMKGK